MTRAYPLTPVTLARLLRPLDDATFASFVADLRRESGWETSAEGPTVTISRTTPREETRRLRVVGDDRSRLQRFLGRQPTLPDLDGVDVLVVGTLEGDRLADDVPDGVTVLDVGDLYDQLLYGVDRATARSLCRDHFERAVNPLPPERRSAGRHRLRLEQLVEQTRENQRAAAVAAAFVLILVVATVGVIGTGGGPVVEPGGGATPGDSEDLATPVGLGAPVVATVTPTPPPTPFPTPMDTSLRLPDDEDRWESVYYHGPNEVVRSFTLAMRTNAEDERFSEFARQMFAPDWRPNLSVLRDALRNGTYRPLRTFDWITLGGVDGLPDLESNETITRGYVVLHDGSNRTIYEYRTVCRFHEEVQSEGCWQLEAFTRVNVSDTDDEAREEFTPTPARIPPEWDTVSTEWGPLPRDPGDVCLDSPRLATQVFVRWLEVSDEPLGDETGPSGSDAIRSTRVRLALNATDPSARPPFDAFLETVRNRSYRHLLSFDRMHYGSVAGLPERVSNETIQTEYLTVWEENSRSIYVVQSTRASPDADCWAVAGLQLIDSENN